MTRDENAKRIQWRKNRLEALEGGMPTYNGRPCDKCGTTEKYTLRYECVRCSSERTYHRRKKKPTESYDLYKRIKRKHAEFEALLGEDHSAEWRKAIAEHKALTGISVERDHTVFWLGNCAHPGVRDKNTGKCLTCHAFERADAFDSQVVRKGMETPEAAAAAIGVAVLPDTLVAGFRCKRGHPGVRYKSNGACIFCVKEKRRGSRRAAVDARPLMWAAVLV